VAVIPPGFDFEVSRESLARTTGLKAPLSLARYLALKGSVTVNGVSLTINQVTDVPDGCIVSVNLIPHTVAVTTLKALVPGAHVNLEVDMIARYLDRMRAVDAAAGHAEPAGS
jgi:riboflavin synthase